jgi:hypothetical protein
MSRYKLIVLVVAMGAMLLVAPAASQACGFFDCLFGGCGRTTYAPPAQAATFAPAYAPGCSTCTTQTVAYMPRTYYRAAYPVTVYRPTNYWTRQARLMPYTTNRLVYSRAYPTAYGCAPAVSCNPCGTGACGYGTAVGSGCSSCSTATTYSSEPAAAPTNPETPQPTFQQETKRAPTTPIKPIPETGKQMNSTQGAPMLIDPENRMTARPIRQATHYRLISKPPRDVVDSDAIDSGWRASKD